MRTKFVFFFISVLFLSACREENELKEISVILDWKPNTNHTGIYVAQKLGYYEQAGLDVEIIQPPEGLNVQFIANGEGDFGISFQENVTYARHQGIPIISIASIIQHNTSGFVSIADKNIKTPKDFEGKTFGSWNSPVEEAIIKSLMEVDNGDFEKVQFTNIGNMEFIRASENGDIDFVWGYEAWDNIGAQLRGYEINYIRLRDYVEALDFYTPVFIASESMIESSPELVRSFMNATKKGYEYSIDKPLDAANILLEYALELDEDLVINSQEFLAKEYQSDAPYWGYQDINVWDRYQSWLFDNGLVEEKIDMKKAFTNEFSK